MPHSQVEVRLLAIVGAGKRQWPPPRGELLGQSVRLTPAPMVQSQTPPESAPRHPPAPVEQRDERERRNAWEDEGGSVDQGAQDGSRYADKAISGRIVQAGGPGRPLKAVLIHQDGRTSERTFATMREGEAFIRSMTPVPPKRDSSRDRGPGKS